MTGGVLVAVVSAEDGADESLLQAVKRTTSVDARIPGALAFFKLTDFPHF